MILIQNCLHCSFDSDIYAAVLHDGQVFAQVFVPAVCQLAAVEV